MSSHGKLTQNGCLLQFPQTLSLFSHAANPGTAHLVCVYACVYFGMCISSVSYTEKCDVHLISEL